LKASGFLSIQFKDILCLKRVGFVTKSDSLLSDSNDKKEQLRIRNVEFSMDRYFRPEKAQGIYQAKCHCPVNK